MDHVFQCIKHLKNLFKGNNFKKYAKLPKRKLKENEKYEEKKRQKKVGNEMYFKIIIYFNLSFNYLLHNEKKGNMQCIRGKL